MSKAEFSSAVGYLAKVLQEKAQKRIATMASFNQKPTEAAYYLERASLGDQLFLELSGACTTLLQSSRDGKVAPRIIIEADKITIAATYANNPKKLGHGIIHYNGR